MVCDLRVVAPDAYFQFPVAKYGLALDNWSIRRLTSLVGHGRARGMLLAAERLTADTALQTGMANRIGTLADAQAWAAEIAGFAPLALQHAKRVLNDDGAYEDPRPVAQGTVRPGLGQPGRHRGAGGAHREAAARSSRAPDGGASGGCASASARPRCVGRRLGAAGAAGHPGGPGCRTGGDRRGGRRRRTTATGSFHNLEPASSGLTWTANSSACCCATLAKPARAGGRPATIPLVDGRRPACAAAAWPSPGTATPAALIEIDGYRVLADPVWSERCSPSRRRRPAAAAPGAGAAGRAARGGRGASSATTTTTTSTSTRSSRWPAPSARRSSCRWASARTCATGASPPTGSSNSTGTRAPRSAS